MSGEPPWRGRGHAQETERPGALRPGPPVDWSAISGERWSRTVKALLLRGLDLHHPRVLHHELDGAVPQPAKGAEHLGEDCLLLDVGAVASAMLIIDIVDCVGRDYTGAGGAVKRPRAKERAAMAYRVRKPTPPAWLAWA